jgi:serine/threonine-protein kinase ATR
MARSPSSLTLSLFLIHRIPQTVALRTCIARTVNPVLDEKRGYRTGERAVNFHLERLRRSYDQAQALFFTHGNLTGAATAFEHLMKDYPPVLFWYFVHRFVDPHAWYEARKRFIVSIAAWSAIGHVIGLGDRHSENILIDQTSGECVHVDFDCILDKGLYLPKPEVVPFRLTQNIIDVLGPTGTDGLFAQSLGVAMQTLRKNRDTLLSVLEPFVKDPVINWKKTRRPDATTTATTTAGAHLRPRHPPAGPPVVDPSAAARQKMRVIECRLKGIYNIRNPNLRKIRRTDMNVVVDGGGAGISHNSGSNNNNTDELVNLVHHSLPLSVEGQVQKLIAEATKSENLVQIYYGWMPWV